MQQLHNLMRKFGYGLLTLLFAACLGLATPSNAEARGDIEVGAAFGWIGLVHDAEDIYNGFTFSIDAGYRFTDWVGLYIEQDLGGIWHEDDDHVNGFYGATLVEGKFIYAVNSLELFGKVGLGATYVDVDYDGYGDWDNAWFAIRLGIGATYMIGSNWGLGLNFDWTPGFDDDVVMHFIKLQLHLAFKF